MATLQIRDKRGGDRYFVDNAFLKGGWGKKVGPYGIAIYNALVLHADLDNQTAYPSYKRLADLTGMSRQHAIRMVAKLESYNIISKTAQYNEKGENTSNVYELLHPNRWRDEEYNIEAEGGNYELLPLVSDNDHPGNSQLPKQDSIDKTQFNNESTTTTGDLHKLYQDNINPLPGQIEIDDLNDYIDTYPAQWVEYAIKTAARANKKTIRYIGGILKNIESNGGNLEYNGGNNGTSRNGQRGNTQSQRGTNGKTRGARYQQKPTAADEQAIIPLIGIE